MEILFVYVALLIHVVLHERAHAVAMRKAGVRVVEAGLGMNLPPRKVFTDRRGFRWSISPWLVGAYVKPHADDFDKLRNGPYAQAAWQFNAGVVTNLVLGLGALALAGALGGSLIRAAIMAVLAAASWAWRKQVAAYIIPAIGPVLLGWFLWSIFRAVNSGAVIGMTGMGEIAPASLGLADVLRVFGVIGVALAMLNAVPLMPLDNGQVWDRLLHRWFGHKAAHVWMAAGVGVMGATILYAVFSDLLNLAGVW